MDRSERPRPNSHHIVETEDDKALRDYENKHKISSSVIFAQHGCNVDLLAGLLKECCMTSVSYGQPFDYYRSLAKCHNEYRMNKVYENKLISEYPFPLSSPEKDARMHGYYLYCMLMGGSAGYKTIIIDDADNISNVVDLIRAISENQFIKIIFLTNDFASDRGKMQLAEFRANFEIGDVMLKEESLNEDPVSFLLKTNPAHYPRIELIKKFRK